MFICAKLYICIPNINALFDHDYKYVSYISGYYTIILNFLIFLNRYLANTAYRMMFKAYLSKNKNFYMKNNYATLARDCTLQVSTMSACTETLASRRSHKYCRSLILVLAYLTNGL